MTARKRSELRTNTRSHVLPTFHVGTRFQIVNGAVASLQWSHKKENTYILKLCRKDLSAFLSRETIGTHCSKSKVWSYHLAKSEG